MSEVRGRDRRVGAVVYTNGAEVRAYARGGRTFRVAESGARRTTRSRDAGNTAPAVSLVDETGAAWRAEEDALVGPEGARLERLPGHLAYWFGWFSFFPETDVFAGE